MTRRWFLVTVAGASMQPTLHPGDVLVVRRSATVRAGDVVVASFLARPGRLVVKRAMRQLADGNWELAGDNAAASQGSESFGPVPPQDVLGRAVWRWWPVRAAGPVRRRPPQV
ncbi:MAG: S26 family signal peptidase [Actinomycetota bacterium]|nr:S26 family signal peptidase [Actinomycetota bacterium]